jgi:hypothetical protein
MTNSSNSARVKFSLVDGLIEIEGSEKFVAEQLTKFEPLMTRILQSGSTPPNPTGTQTSKKKDATSPDASGFEAYENLYAMADGKVQILKDLPGANKSQKTVNAALLLAYANQLQGASSTTYEAVRTLCLAHACLDSANFSSAIKGEKAYFIISGTSGSQSIALTVPGKKKATEIANSLNI